MSIHLLQHSWFDHQVPVYWIFQTITSTAMEWYVFRIFQELYPSISNKYLFVLHLQLQCILCFQSQWFCTLSLCQRMDSSAATTSIDQFVFRIQYAFSIPPCIAPLSFHWTFVHMSLSSECSLGFWMLATSVLLLLLERKHHRSLST